MSIASNHPDLLITAGAMLVLTGFYLTPLFPLWACWRGAQWLRSKLA